MDLLQLLLKNKKAVIILAVFVIFIVMSSLIIFSNNSSSTSHTGPTPTLVSGPSSVLLQSTIPQQPFRVLQTSPNDGEQAVNTGEIVISFTTDVPIVSRDAFDLSITPQLPYYWKFINNYPTQSVQAQVFGGLQTDTQYTVTVKDHNRKIVSTWRFTTSQTPPESSSNLIKDQEQQKISKYYPLLQYVPYSNNDFSIDYTDHLTLSVQIKNSNTDMVKQEVLDWIKSHGVDPTTHTIYYTNTF